MPRKYILIALPVLMIAMGLYLWGQLRSQNESANSSCALPYYGELFRDCCFGPVQFVRPAGDRRLLAVADITLQEYDLIVARLKMRTLSYQAGFQYTRPQFIPLSFSPPSGFPIYTASKKLDDSRSFIRIYFIPSDENKVGRLYIHII